VASSGERFLGNAAATAELDETQAIALLPAVDPVVGAVMVMLAMTMGGATLPAARAAFSPSLQAVMGPRRADVRYSLTPLGLEAHGTLNTGTRGSQPIHESLRPTGDNSATLTGQVGDLSENLTIEPTDAGIHVTGGIGVASVDLMFSLPTSGFLMAGGQPSDAVGQQWAQVNGTIADTPYSALATLTPPEGDDMAAVKVDGTLGNDTLSKSYRVSCDAKVSTITLEGSGQVAGNPQSITMTVAMG
jgi:hypothetical protein